MRIFRYAGKEIPGLRTEFIEGISMKLSLMQSTVDWIDGSKSLATCSLYMGRDGSDNGWGGGRELPC